MWFLYTPHLQVNKSTILYIGVGFFVQFAFKGKSYLSETHLKIITLNISLKLNKLLFINYLKHKQVICV